MAKPNRRWQLWLHQLDDGQPVSAQDYNHQMAEHTAYQIHHILTLPATASAIY